MKRLFAIVLSAALLLTLGGCSVAQQEGYQDSNDSYDDGYAWAEDNDVDNFNACQSEFGTGDAEDGCNDYVKENYSGYQTFHGYDCTEDCSGHEAGYEWAEENDISDAGDCGGNSNSFIEGCRAYVEENY